MSVLSGKFRSVNATKILTILSQSMTKVDMIFEGSHRKTDAEHWQYVRACQRRVEAGRESDRVRQDLAEVISRHYKCKFFVEAL